MAGPTKGGHGRLDVDEPAVQKSNRANGVAGHVDADLAIVDVQGLVRPTPVPQLHDGCFGAVEGEVAHCVLLVAELSALLAAVEDQVRQHAAASFLHEDTGMIIFGSGGKLEDAVLDRGSLGRGPMEASDGTWDVRGVKDKVADLTEEDIGGFELKGCADTVSWGNNRGQMQG